MDRTDHTGRPERSGQNSQIRRRPPVRAAGGKAPGKPFKLNYRMMLCIAVLVCFVLALLFFRRGLVRLIRDYNGEMRKIEMKVALSCHFFEGYLSRVCAYMRGRSIVDVLRSKEMRMQEGIYQMEKHHAAIARCYERTRGWMRDFGLDVLPDDQQGRAEYFNAAIDPEENEAYDLRTEHSGSIRDSQGKRILVPYPFVSEMEIKREETAQ